TDPRAARAVASLWEVLAGGYGLCASPGGERVQELSQVSALGGQHVLDVRRPRVADLATQNPRTFELAETLRERRRRGRPPRPSELREARAALVGGVQDRDGVPALEDVRGSADVLGDRLARPTPRHRAAPAVPRARDPAPRRST